MIPVKIQCGCGQRYAFDVEPVCGRMIARVACPVCGLDGTRIANEIIAYNLAREMSKHGSSKQNVMIFAVIGCLIAGIVGVIKALNMAHGFDVLLCLLGATVAFGMALCVYFWRR
jgi:UDP-N-acetylmuramyl pentapeptide phosphotransferase/UDP-N-acetylglucosamine-1-phosphate transferase